MPRPPAAPTARAPPRAQTACNSANPPPASGAVHAPGAGRAAPPMQLAHRRLPRPAPPVGRPTRRSSTGGGRRPGAGGHRTPAPGVACGLLTPETSPRAPGRPRERHGAGRRSARHRPGSLVRRPARRVGARRENYRETLKMGEGLVTGRQGRREGVWNERGGVWAAAPAPTLGELEFTHTAIVCPLPAAAARAPPPSVQGVEETARRLLRAGGKPGGPCDAK
jgi:hypothetical protein